MPAVTIQKADIAEILPLTVKFLGIADANTPEGGAVAPGAPFTLDQIKKFIFSADYEIALLIADNLEHPYRTIFPTVETDYLADGAQIPAHLAPHTHVVLKNDDEEIPGRQRDYARLKRIRANPVIYNSPVDLYAIFGGRIFFADALTTGKLDIPIVNKDLTLTTLLAPTAYAYGIIAGAIVRAAMPGFSAAHRQYWGNLWTMYAREISGGAVALPETEQLERLGT